MRGSIIIFAIAASTLPALTTSKPITKRQNDTCTKEGELRCYSAQELDICKRFGDELHWALYEVCPREQICVNWRGAPTACQDYAPLVDCYPWCGKESAEEEEQA